MNDQITLERTDRITSQRDLRYIKNILMSLLKMIKRIIVSAAEKDLQN
jgi:hypothetical protein